MNASDVEMLVSRITYKPDFKFEVLDGIDGVAVTVTAMLDDVFNPQQKILVARQQFLHAMRLEQMSIGELLEQVRQLVILVETHEVDEWLHFAGTCITDPHPELHRVHA